MSVNKVILLILCSFALIGCLKAKEEKVKQKNQESSEKKIEKTYFDKVAENNNCKLEKNNYYSPFLLKGLVNDSDEKLSAIFYCRKNELGIFIHIDNSISQKLAISKCPNFISGIPENGNMGLEFRNGKIFSGLGEGGAVYSCKNGTWEQDRSD